ncbi:hypothetical protein HELRODRAFT_184857 [Helobdella robusta]|uniref:Serine aminopeptidase S33 domain-containing protein n=1 Tax=Helobdella robusta TaxID=6412 RepID=T1FM33_HELRO|nr:hypothetical protein HELRODRAFT_184857 [Helobdella robusta]ESO12972.1 hypothetical protein HELRODRAFT_184857 [Helobdella robusta]
MFRNNKSSDSSTDYSCYKGITPRPPIHPRTTNNVGERGDARDGHTDGSHHHPSAASQSNLTKPHNIFVVFLLKFCGYLLLLLFFIIPAVIKIYPSILGLVVFCNYVKLPFGLVDYQNTTLHGLNNAYNFHLQVNEKVSLGAWHILPKDLKVPKNVELKASSVNDLLDNDNAIVLYLHGNAGDRTKSFRVNLYKTLSSRGFHVIAFDYRGYGDSSSWPSKSGLVEDASVMFDWLKKTARKKANIFIWGHSLGSAIAVELAKDLGNKGITFSGLVLETPFTNAIELADTHFITTFFRWLPYYSWVVVDAVKQADITLPNDQNILDVKEKILILHAEDDQIVPYTHGKKLYEVAKTRTKDPNMTKLITYESKLGYGHKKISTNPNLMDDFVSFMGIK